MKSLLTLFLLFISANLYSQIEKPIVKGNIIFGGNGMVSYNRINIERNISNFSIKYISATLNPSIGYFIYDGLALGLSVNSNYIEGLEDYKRSSLELGLGPFFKYYTSLGLFAGSRINYSIHKEIGSNYINNSYSIIPEIGYAYFINSNISFESSLNHTYVLSKNNIGNELTTINNTYLTFGFQMFIR